VLTATLALEEEKSGETKEILCQTAKVANAAFSGSGSFEGFKTSLE
jgi:hypothetical protein